MSNYRPNLDTLRRLRLLEQGAPSPRRVRECAGALMSRLEYLEKKITEAEATGRDVSYCIDEAQALRVAMSLYLTQWPELATAGVRLDPYVPPSVVDVVRRLAAVCRQVADGHNAENSARSALAMLASVAGSHVALRDAIPPKG